MAQTPLEKGITWKTTVLLKNIDYLVEQFRLHQLQLASNPQNQLLNQQIADEVAAIQRYVGEQKAVNRRDRAAYDLVKSNLENEIEKENNQLLRLNPSEAGEATTRGFPEAKKAVRDIIADLKAMLTALVNQGRP